MLYINLPIINDNKIIRLKFKLIIEDKKIKVDSINNEYVHWVPVFSRNYGYTKSLVFFPFEIEIYNNQYLWFVNSIEVSFYQDTYKKFEYFDFYSSFLNKINNIYTKMKPNIILKYFKYNNLLSFPKILLNKMIEKFNNKLSTIDESIILEDILKNVYDYYTNTKMLFILFSYQFILNPSKKKTFLNFIKSKKTLNDHKSLFRLYFYKLYFNSDDRISIINILENRNNKLQLNEINKNNKYYVSKTNVGKDIFFLVKVLERSEKTISLSNFQKINYDKYNWYESIPNIDFDINNIFFKIINSFYNLELLENNSYFDIFNLNGLERLIPVILGEKKLYPTITILKKFNIKKIVSKSKDIINLDQINDDSKLEGFDIYRSIDKIDLSYLANKLLSNNDLNEIVFYFEEYFKKITYPIKFNRRFLDPYFDKILYLSLHLKDIIIINSGSKIYLSNSISQIIPIKMKNFFTNILKYMVDLIKNGNTNNFIYNYKFYQDTIYQSSLRIILTSDNCLSNQILRKLLGKKSYLINEILLMWRQCYFLRNIANVLKWNKIKDFLPYLKYILDNQELIFFNNKLNKSIFPPDFDEKLRKIIICPFKMFQYLTKKIDFIKWTCFLGKKCNSLYNNSISLSSEDIKLLGELIFYLYDVDIQTFSNKKYQILLNFSKNNLKLIARNGRINLKIKEKLGKMKCNYNLGFLAKHITYNNSDSISLSETSKEKSVDESELNDLKYKLSIVTKKYYKYKAKYLKNKDRDGLIGNMSTSNFSTI